MDIPRCLCYDYRQLLTRSFQGIGQQLFLSYNRKEGFYDYTRTGQDRLRIYRLYGP